MLYLISHSKLKKKSIERFYGPYIVAHMLIIAAISLLLFALIQTWPVHYSDETQITSYT